MLDDNERITACEIPAGAPTTATVCIKHVKHTYAYMLGRIEFSNKISKSLEIGIINVSITDYIMQIFQI